MSGNEQRTLVQGIFLFPFSSGDREADSGQTPGSTMLSVLPPKENLAQICPKLPSLWLSFLKKQTTKRQKKKSTLCLECSRRLNHRGCGAFVGGSPSAAAWESRVASGGGWDNSCGAFDVGDFYPRYPGRKSSAFHVWW